MNTENKDWAEELVDKLRNFRFDDYLDYKECVVEIRAAFANQTAELLTTIAMLKSVNCSHEANAKSANLLIAAYERRALVAEAQTAELCAWKESAMKVMPDFQAIGSALDVGLGQSVHDKILPGIIALKQRAESAEAQVKKLESNLSAAIFCGNLNQQECDIALKERDSLREQLAQLRAKADELAEGLYNTRTQLMAHGAKEECLECALSVVDAALSAWRQP